MSDCLVRISLFVSIIGVLFISPAYGQERSPDEVGIQENLGQTVPLDLTFFDERGSALKLGDIIDKPSILSFVYYHCSHICPQMLLGLSEVFEKLEMMPGKDYRVVTMSFDDTDTPEDARSQKVNYLKAAGRPFPAGAWKFLTGDSESIRKVTEAVGITFRKGTHGFIHPEVLVFVSPQGRITRYLYVSKSSYGVGYPVNFSAVDVTKALTDASKGVTQAGVKTTPLLCFPHEPEQQKIFFRILWIVGAITLLFMVSFFAYLSFTSRKAKGGK